MTASKQPRPTPDLTLLPTLERARHYRPVVIWLLSVAGLVFAMAVIGAITRLTESGLSMVEWKVLSQDIPPMSQAGWEHVFALYQQSPQYRYINTGMTLDEFKGIFWWEWVHRLIGQAVGVAFAIPFLWFLARRRLPRRLVPYLVGLFALGALQGLVGWLMVASGLVDRPAVSHYRLAMHLALALTIYALTLWTAFVVAAPRAVGGVQPELGRRLRRHAVVGLSLLGVTIVWGAFTAGLRAGLLYNTFPLMGGQIAPPDMFAIEPWWSNFTQNPGAVQFVHRVLAITTGLALFGLGARLRELKSVPALRQIGAILAGDVLLQIGLGIATLLTQVPIWLGALHQANAVLLLGVTIRTLFLLRPEPKRQFRPRLIVTRNAA